MPTSQKDTEITLGTGRMLAIFFALVLVCAVFFAIGFSLGRKTSLLGMSGGAKASTGGPAAGPQAGKEGPKPASQPTDFSFYKSVGANSANTELAPSNSAAQAAAGNSPTPVSSAPSSPSSGNTTAANATHPGGGYFVQVAAVTRKEDADALVEALKKKQYPAFSANNSSTDKYYHIQVGPYADLKEAEAMRARLISDGYNPILKK